MSSPMLKSPTASFEFGEDLYQPQWKIDLLRRRQIQQKLPIRLPSVIVDRERKVSQPLPSPIIINGDLSFTARTNKNHVDTDDKEKLIKQNVHTASNINIQNLVNQFSQKQHSSDLAPLTASDFEIQLVNDEKPYTQQQEVFLTRLDGETSKNENNNKVSKEMKAISPDFLEPSEYLDIDYSPGIVNRMKEKFSSLSVGADFNFNKQVLPMPPSSPVPPPTSVPPLRHSSSLEYLLDMDSEEDILQDDRAELAVGFVKRRQQDLFKPQVNSLQSALSFIQATKQSAHRKSPYNSSPKKVIIIEQSSSGGQHAPKTTTQQSVKRSLQQIVKATSNDNEETPQSVRQRINLFINTDVNIKSVFSIPNKTAAVSAPKSPISDKPVDMIIESRKEDGVENNKIIPSQSPSLDIKSQAKKPSGGSYIQRIASQFQSPNSYNVSMTNPEIVITTSSPKIPTPPPPKPSNIIVPVPQKPVVTIPPYFDEIKPTPKPPYPYGSHSVVILPSSINTSHLPGQSLSDNKPREIDDVKPTSALKPMDQDRVETDMSTPIKMPELEPWMPKKPPAPSRDNSLKDKPVDFVGANIIVGRSSILKTRNKKLQLMFDDKALSTYEYDSEWTLLEGKSDSDDGEDSFDSSKLLSKKPPDYDKTTNKNKPGGFDNYSPLVLNSVTDLNSGLPQKVQPSKPTFVGSIKKTFEDDVILSLNPSPKDENVLWSNTQTSDILF